MDEMMQRIHGGIMGLAIGDALGVPAEFMSRLELRDNPVTKMRGGGAHGQKAGTWSDDTSMTLCLANSLANTGSINPQDIMEEFLAWLTEGAYTANGEVFDVGNTCGMAIRQYWKGVEPELCGQKDEGSNGNGALMRILPMALYCHTQGIRSIFSSEKCLHDVHMVTALTHAHPRSLIACGLYVEIGLMLLLCHPLRDAITEGLKNGYTYYAKEAGPAFVPELPYYGRLHDLAAFSALPESAIRSSGYVVDTLEAAIWSLMNTQSFAECVLLAVNLGDDTDTVAAVAGGLAGLYYGLDNIPKEWRADLRNSAVIEDICLRLYRKLNATANQKGDTIITLPISGNMHIP